jgi:DNA-binding NarL/FixJ family response regulator
VIRVMLVDDHPVVREGLRGMLEAEPDLTVVGEAGSGEEAVAQASVVEADVILMDLRMRGLDGVGATEQILAGPATAKVVVLTTSETDADRGETVLAPSVAGRLVNQVRRPATQTLSAREVEVLALVAKGQTNAEIGRSLYISEATVKTHLLRSFGKLGVSDRTAAVTTAMARGLLA